MLGDLQTYLPLSRAQWSRLGQGALVLGTFAHQDACVLDLFIEGSKEPLGVTDNHLIYSADRDAFVPAGALKTGENLRTISGTAALASVRMRPGKHRVYNIEVEGIHVYHVTDLGVLVHNQKALFAFA